MDRREVLKLSGFGLGLTLSGTTILSLISSCKEDIAKGVTAQAIDKNGFALLEELAEMILPKTLKSPGASEVGVAPFIELFVSKVYNEEKQKQFNADLMVLDKECNTKFGKKLIECDEKQKVDFIKGLESDEYEPAVYIWGNKVSEGGDMPFYKQLKSLILWAYFSSEKVGKEVLVYQQLAPGYEGCIDVTENTRLRSI